MKLCNTFNQYLIPIYLLLLIHHCFGQEHHDKHYKLTDLAIINDTESAVIADSFTQHIVTTNIHPIPIERKDDHFNDAFQARQDYFNKLNQLVENEYNIENGHGFQHLPSLSSLQLSDDTSSQNQTSVVDKTETMSPLLTSQQTQIEQQQSDIIKHNQLEVQQEPVFNTNDDGNNSISSQVRTDPLTSNQQICWRLPKPIQSGLESIENQTLYLINLLPKFIQTILFGHTDDLETLINTMWFDFICLICFLFSLIFLTIGFKRLKQHKCEKKIRSQCQQLQQYNDEVVFECATYKRKHQKLLNEIDQMKNLSMCYEDDIDELRKECIELQNDLQAIHSEHDDLQNDIRYKQNLIEKHEFDMQKQMEIVAHLNNEILEYQQQLEKERETISRLQSNDLSLERFEKLQQIINELKSEITQLKQDKLTQTDQLQQVQEHANQLDIDNNELTIKMKQLRDLLEQRDQTIDRIREKILNNNNDDDEKATEIGDLLSTIRENSPENNQQNELLSTIDNDVQKANRHMRDLHSEIEEKTRRIKEIDLLLNQEKDRCRELETKLKVVLELRERDAHIHIRQLGQTDSELRSARTDTERVKILQNQLELKQQQLEDVQRVLGSEQTKFSEECSKLQHETHEKWMEVKRLTRELDGARKECEGLRRQITKYGNNDRPSQEKTMHKSVLKDINNTGRVSSEPETNGSSPPLPLHSQERERSLNHSNDLKTVSPVNMFITRPPLFVFSRPRFHPPSIVPSMLPNRFMLPARFPIPFDGPQRIITKDDFLSTKRNKT